MEDQMQRHKAAVTELVKNKTNVSSHSSKGYRTAKNLGVSGQIDYTEARQSKNMLENAGQAYGLTKKSATAGRKNKRGMSLRMQQAFTSRPTMHIKEGKLMLTGHVDKKTSFF